MPFERNLFETYASHIPEAKVADQPLPPENVPVICTAPSLHPNEFEAMVVKAAGRSGLRWQIFNVRGRPVSYPHRGWMPERWRFKHYTRSQ